MLPSFEFDLTCKNGRLLSEYSQPNSLPWLDVLAHDMALPTTGTSATHFSQSESQLRQFIQGH